jgi:hypothetical protein
MRLLTAVGLLVAGAVTSLAAVALHERWWGLPLAVAATGLALAMLAPGWWSRLAFAVGWAGMLLVLASPRPEGDYAVSRDLPGYALLGLGLGVLLAGLVTLPRPGGRG